MCFVEQTPDIVLFNVQVAAKYEALLMYSCKQINLSPAVCTNLHYACLCHVMVEGHMECTQSTVCHLGQCTIMLHVMLACEQHSMVTPFTCSWPRLLHAKVF